ncbi:hypothetical protein [Actinoplanes sp. NPDC049681]|uniref:hypothetical protein n=1 Tax=Actinoplanes sp. NPDC049681 TaxID=3363905 RepID=UPI00379A8179
MRAAYRQAGATVPGAKLTRTAKAPERFRHLQSATMITWSPIRSAAALVTLAALLGGCTVSSRWESTLPAASSGDGRPERLAIDHDDFGARYVGHTADGRQFFVTTPFESGEEGRTFVATYLFTADGRFLEAEIEPTEGGDDLYQVLTDADAKKQVRKLGEVTYDRIVVEPFEVHRYGNTFGLIVHEPDADDDLWWVTVEPGDYMAFAAPWDSGVYDT